MLSDFICAGVETFYGILRRFVNEPERGFDNHFTEENIKNLFDLTCNKFLHSFGQNFVKRENTNGYAKSEANKLYEIKRSNMFKNCLLYVDSGGFQISKGVLNLNQTNMLYRMYYDFLQEFHDCYDISFILDLPPGQGGNPKFFETFKDVFDWNFRSYNEAASLPAKARDKMIYIHHFRTPELWTIFTRILREGDLFKHFKYHGTGGMVANLASDAQTPCITYILPLIPLINEAKRNKRDFLNFHVLGIGNYRDIFFYELFKIHVQKVHKINLQITYDSAGVFHQFNRARYLLIYDDNDNHVIKMRLNSENLDKRFGRKDKRVIEAYREIISNFAKIYHLKQIPMNQIYQNEGEGTFFDEIKVYSMLYMLESYRKVQTLLKSKCEFLYPLYSSRQIQEFSHEAELITRSLNYSKITRKQKAKTNSLIRSLDMLTTLDEDYCEYIVKRFLSKDEFTNLLNTESMIL